MANPFDVFMLNQHIFIILLPIIVGYPRQGTEGDRGDPRISARRTHTRGTMNIV